MNFMERIHLAILRAVQEKDIKIEEIEKATGISVQEISGYFKGHSYLSNSGVQKLIDFLEIDISIRFPIKKVEVEKWICCE